MHVNIGSRPTAGSDLHSPPFLRATRSPNTRPVILASGSEKINGRMSQQPVPGRTSGIKPVAAPVLAAAFSIMVLGSEKFDVGAFLKDVWQTSPTTLVYEPEDRTH